MHTFILVIEFVAACVRNGSRVISNCSLRRANGGCTRSLVGANTASVVFYENAS